MSWSSGSRRRRHHLHLPLRGNRHQLLLRPRLTHCKLALRACGDYRQGIQCWASHKQGFVSTSAQRVKQTLGTQSSQEFPALDPTMHCKVPCVKVPTTANHRCTQFQDKVQHHATHNHSTRTAVPIRRIVSSSLKDKTQTLVPACVPGPVPRCATMRQLQFQVQSLCCDEVHKSHDALRSALRTNTRARINNSTVDV